MEISAKAGDQVLCEKCRKVVGVFKSDCADYNKISRDLLNRGDQFPVSIESFKSDATRYGCEACDFEAMKLDGEFWMVTGTVVASR